MSQRPIGPDWCPRKSEQVTLHEVASEREGKRFVLRHEETGDYLDLPGGEQDAFVWARLDGKTTVGRLAQAYLEEYGAIHPDLALLIERLRDTGMLEDAPVTTAQPRLAGRRLTQLAGELAMIRIPIPWTEPLWRVIGRLAAPLYSVPAGALALIVGIAGLVLALGPWGGLEGGTPLLEWPTATGSSLLLGLLALLALNAAVDLFEAVAQVATLARGRRSPGRIGLSFDLGVPGIYIETPEAILLPLEKRVWQVLAPLFAAGLVGGLATIAHWRISPDHTGAFLVVLCHKLAWVAWLRCAVHVSPIGPTPLYEALCEWWSMPRLRQTAVRALRGQVNLGAELDEGVSRRELAVLTYLGLTIVFFVVLARLGAYLLHSQLLPAWDLAGERSDGSRVFVLAVLGLVLAVPTLLALGGGLLMSLQAGLRALARSDLFPTPGRLGAALLVGTIGLGVAPRFLVDPVRGWSQESLLWIAALLAAVSALEGRRLRIESGQGWGGLGGIALGLAGGLLSAFFGHLLFFAPYGAFGQLFAGLLVLGIALALYSWGVVETYRSFRRLRLPLALSGVICLPLGLLPGTAHPSNPLAGPLLLPCIGLTLLAAVLGLSAWLRARRGARQAGLLLVSLGILAVSAGLGAWWSQGEVELLLRPSNHMLGGAHLPFLAAGLLASGTWLLRRARGARAEMPEAASALRGTTEEERQIAACTFVIESLYLGVRDVFGSGVVRAVAQDIEDDERIRIDREGRAQDLVPEQEEDAARRAWRFRFAVASFYRLARERSGDGFFETLLRRVVTRLPARAHEAIGESAPSALPVLGAITEAPEARRIELLSHAVPFLDFPAEAVQELAQRVGVRRFEPGEVIIRQGNIGDCFFVMAEGEARVLIEDASGGEREIATLSDGDAFGEAALLVHEPRSASVVASKSSLVLTLERETFSGFMQEHKDLLASVFARQDDLRLLREVPLFAGMTGEEITILCRRLRPLKIDGGAAVITQGDVGDRFYLVREGQLEVRHTVDGGEETKVAELARGDYFGEIALLNDTPRTATVLASRPCELLALERDDFHELLSGRPGQRLARQSIQRIQELQGA